MRLTAIAFVLLVSPFAQADTPISTVVTGPTPETVGRPYLAVAGDGYLAFWPEGDTSAVTLRAVRLDATGSLRGGSFPVGAADFGLVSWPRVVSDGTSAFPLWQSYAQSGQSSRHMARVDVDGAVTLFPDLPVPSSDSYSAMGAAAGDGKVMIVYADDNRTLTATLLDRNGVLLRSRLPVAQTGAGRINAMDVAWAGGNAFLLTWVDVDGRVRFVRLRADDVAAGTVTVPPFVRATTDGGASFLRVVSDCTHSMVFWQETSAQPFELRARALSSSGEALGNQPTILGNVSETGEMSISITPDGYRILAPENGQLVQVRLSFDGVVQSFTRASFFGTPSWGGFSAVSRSDGSTLAITNAVDGSAPHGEVAVSPVAADATTGAGSIISLGLPRQSVHALQPWQGGAVALWSSTGASTRLVLGRFTGTGKPLDGAGLDLATPGVPQKNAAMGVSEQQLLVTWTASSGVPAKLYGVIVSSSNFAQPAVRELAGDASTSSGTEVVWNGSSFTVVYQRSGTADLVARRVDTAGNVIDAQPIVLTPPRDAQFFADANPRLSWSGHDYLLAWQRQSYYFEPSPILPIPILANELFAQRLTASLTPVGAEIALQTIGGKATATGQEITRSGGLSLVSWSDSITGAAWARIDDNGVRLDPLNGRSVPGLYAGTLVAAVPGGWMLLSGLAVARLGLDGAAGQAVPLPRALTVESFTMAPLPLFTYKRFGDPLAYIDTLPQHRRATSP